MQLRKKVSEKIDSVTFQNTCTVGTEIFGNPLLQTNLKCFSGCAVMILVTLNMSLSVNHNILAAVL